MCMVYVGSDLSVVCVCYVCMMCITVMSNTQQGSLQQAPTPPELLFSISKRRWPLVAVQSTGWVKGQVSLSGFSFSIFKWVLMAS